MKPNYRRIIAVALEDGVHNGLHSLEGTDIENLDEDELIATLTRYVMDELDGWLDLGEKR